MENRNFINEKIESLEKNCTKLFIVAEKYLIEDYYEEDAPMFVVDTEESAKEIVDELNLFAKILKAEKIMFYGFKDKWCDEHPLKLESQLGIPKWKAGIGLSEITKEMRTKRTVIMQRNKRIEDRNRELHDERDKLMYEAFAGYAKDKNMIYSTVQIERGSTREFRYYPINKIN